MMSNVTRGASAAGLVEYLAEDGRLNVHEDQRVIDGSLGQEGDLADLDFRASIVRDLSAPGQAFPRVKARVRVDGKLQHAPIWHCSLSLKVGETPLTDAQWRPVVRDFMAGMGFPDDSRWVVVGHGLSRDGNPHVHVAASLVTESGDRVSTRLDWPRSQAQCTRLELKYGLRVVESRLTGTGTPGLSQYEAASLRRTGVPPERWQLRDRVRAVTGLAQTEAQFVDRLRASVQVRARAGKDGQVTGYAVAMPDSNVWFGGGTLSRDLSVGSLRRDWRGPQQSKDAWNGQAPVKADPVRLGSVKQVTGELDRLGAALKSGKVEVADAAHQVAGALAAAGRTGEAVECGKLASTPSVPGAGKRVAISAGVFLTSLADQVTPGQAAATRELMALFMAVQAAHQMVAASNRKVAVMAGDNGWGSRWWRQPGNTVVQTPVQQDGQVRQVSERQRAAQARLDARAVKRATMTQPWDAQTIRGFMVADDIAKNHPDAYQHHAPVPVEKVSEVQAARIAALGTQLMGSEFRPDYVNALGKGEATVLERQLENGLGAAQVAKVDAGLSAHADPVRVADPELQGWLDAAQDARRVADPGMAPGVQEWLANEQPLSDAIAPTEAQLMAVENIEGRQFGDADLQPDFQVLDRDSGQERPMTGQETERFTESVRAGDPTQHRVPDPQNWATGLDPVTPAQRGKLLGQGLKPADIDGLTKGYASQVIGGKLEVGQARTLSEQARRDAPAVQVKASTHQEVRPAHLDRVQEQAHRQRRSG